MKNTAQKTESRMSKVWQTIESFVTPSQTDESIRLPKGASEGQILKAETTLGLRLLKDMRDAYRIHDGSGALGLIPFEPWNLGYPLLSLSGVISDWKMIQTAVRRGAFAGPDFVNKPKGPIRVGWFHQAWLPIADDENGDYYFVDMAPAKGGKRGQVIEFLRETGATNVIANSFFDLLAELAADFKAGKYGFDSKRRVVVVRRKRRKQ